MTAKKLSIQLSKENNCEGCRFLMVGSNWTEDEPPVPIVGECHCALTWEQLTLPEDLVGKDLRTIIVGTPIGSQCPLEDA